MNRRGFIGSILALCAAPAIVRADSLMRIIPPRALILWGDGIHDDTLAFQALVQGAVVRMVSGAIIESSPGRIVLPKGTFRVSQLSGPVDGRRITVSQDWS